LKESLAEELLLLGARALETGEQKFFAELFYKKATAFFSLFFLRESA